MVENKMNRVNMDIINIIKYKFYKYSQPYIYAYCSTILMYEANGRGIKHPKRAKELNLCHGFILWTNDCKFPLMI